MLKLSRIAPLQLLQAVHDLQQIEGMLDGYTHIVELNVQSWPSGWDSHLAAFTGVHVGLNIYAAAGDLAELEAVKADWLTLEVRQIKHYSMEEVNREEDFLPLIDSMLDYLEKHWKANPELPPAKFIDHLNLEWERLGLPWEGRAYNRVYELIVNAQQYKTVRDEWTEEWNRDLTQLWLG